MYVNRLRDSDFMKLFVDLNLSKIISEENIDFELLNKLERQDPKIKLNKTFSKKTNQDLSIIKAWKVISNYK